jgi:uncharacterized repeat protein (TIGR01451 family)
MIKGAFTMNLSRFSTALTALLCAFGMSTAHAGSITADHGITVDDGQVAAVPGTPLVYTVVATNAGPSDATNSTVTTTLDAALTCTWTCAASAGSTCTAAGAGDVSDSANLLSGGTATYTMSCDIDPAATGTLTTSASVAVDASVTDPNAADNSAVDDNTILGAEADLGVTKTGPATAIAGGQVTYTIEVTSAGPSDATNVTVNDTPPAGFTFASATAPCAGGFPCNLGTLAPTDVVTFDVTFDIDPAATGTLDNTASVSSDATDPNAANDSDVASTTIGGEADLAITKTDNETLIDPGDSVTYTIVASNAGPSTAPDALVSDIFQLPLINCSWSSVATGGATGNGSGTGDINEVLNMPPGSSVTYTATCGTLITSGPVTNTATISSASVTDPDGANDAGVDADTFLGEIRAIPTLGTWGLLLLLGLIATVGLVRIRASA